MPIVLGCISWLALAAIESKTSSAVLANRVSNLESSDEEAAKVHAELTKALCSIELNVRENTVDGKRIEDKIDSVGKLIIERMEGLAYRLKLVEKS